MKNIFKTNGFDKLAWMLVKFKLRYNRGNSWMNEVTDTANIVIALYAAKSLLEEYGMGTLLSGRVIILLGISRLFIGYFIGWADEVKLLLWQRENTYGSRNVNPVFQKMEQEHTDMARDIAELHKKIDRLCQSLTMTPQQAYKSAISTLKKTERDWKQYLGNEAKKL